MTRDEQRTACISAMKTAAITEDPRILMFSATELDDIFTTAFDALNGIATVSPVEATKEMEIAGFDSLHRRARHPTARDLCIIFDAMVAAGDLTNNRRQKMSDETPYKVRR